MKILYIIIFLLAVYVIYALADFEFILKKAHLPEIAQQNQTIGKGPLIKFIAAGDSTAVGEGASSVEHTYAYQILEYLAVSRTVEYKNVGVRGAKTNDVIANQLAAIIDFKPDIITLSIGANDITHLRSSSSILANFHTILNSLITHTNAQIYITDIPIVDRATLLPYPYRKFLEYQIKKTNPQIIALESNRIHVVDIHEFGWSAYPNIALTFAQDQFHPNDTGYKNWANAFISKMKNLYP